jgi:5-methylcytosine-specific restriction endonuclease McrA
MRKYHKAEPAIQVECLQCNKAFTMSAGQKRAVEARGGQAGKFCSKKCFLVFSNVTVICAVCEKVFTRSKSFVGRYSAKKNYCSRSCSAIGRRSNKPKSLKAKRYGSKAWQRLRLQIIERDGICQLCGDCLANSVHHKNWNPYDNRLENLILLCVPCHGRIKYFEDWDTAKARIMAYSELHGNMQSVAEMSAPLVELLN